MVADDTAVIEACRDYFDGLWRRGSSDLSRDMLDSWEKTVTGHRAAGGRPDRVKGLGDFGADAGLAATLPVSLPVVVADADQAFIKFLGEGDNRVPVAFATIEEIELAGCHWAVAYPATRRPRSVEDGAIMFIARLTDEPDIRIFGRAIGMKYRPVRDDASPEDIALRPWKEKWPRYVRVHIVSRQPSNFLRTGFPGSASGSRQRSTNTAKFRRTSSTNSTGQVMLPAHPQ